MTLEEFNHLPFATLIEMWNEEYHLQLSDYAKKLHDIESRREALKASGALTDASELPYLYPPVQLGLNTWLQTKAKDLANDQSQYNGQCSQ